MSKLSIIINIGKILFGGAAAAIGIAAIFTPAAPIIIIAGLCAFIAWGCDSSEDIIDNYLHLHESNNSEDEDNIDYSCNGDCNDDYLNSAFTIIDLDNLNQEMPLSGESNQLQYKISEV